MRRPPWFRGRDAGTEVGVVAHDNACTHRAANGGERGSVASIIRWLAEACAPQRTTHAFVIIRTRPGIPPCPAAAHSPIGTRICYGGLGNSSHHTCSGLDAVATPLAHSPPYRQGPRPRHLRAKAPGHARSARNSSARRTGHPHVQPPRAVDRGRTTRLQRGADRSEQYTSACTLLEAQTTPQRVLRPPRCTRGRAGHRRRESHLHPPAGREEPAPAALLLAFTRFLTQWVLFVDEFFCDGSAQGGLGAGGKGRRPAANGAHPQDW